MKMMHAEDELTKAAATGNTYHVQFLLSNGVNVNGVNKFGRTPIQVGLRHVLTINKQVKMQT